MFDCNEVVTVWNRWRDPSDNKAPEKFYRHILPVKCKWKHHLNRDVSGTVAAIVGSFVVIVPYSVAYLPADEWRVSSERDRQEHFTIQAGDIVALGAQMTEITGVSPCRESDVRQSLAPECFTIKAYQDNTRSAHGRHYRIEGV